MKAKSTITLSENELKDILIKALGLDQSSTISIYQSTGGNQREPDYSTVTIHTISELSISNIKSAE